MEVFDGVWRVEEWFLAIFGSFLVWRVGGLGWISGGVRGANWLFFVIN